MLGLIVAFIGIGLAQALNMPMLDGVASIVIGAILAIVAMLLAYESKGSADRRSGGTIGHPGGPQDP